MIYLVDEFERESQTSRSHALDKAEIVRNLLKSEESDDENEDDIAGDKEKFYLGIQNPDDYDQYSYACKIIILYLKVSRRNEVRSLHMTSQKLNYILDEVLADLGFTNACSVEFWLSLIILFLAMWIRLYIHYFGSWIYLKLAGVPVTSFKAGV